MADLKHHHGNTHQLPEASDHPVLYFVRELLLPGIVFFFMMRFLCCSVVVPFYKEGMHKKVNRQLPLEVDPDSLAARD